MIDNMTGRLTLTKRELAAHLSVSVRTLDRMRTAGQLPEPITACKRPRWAVATIVSWLHGGHQPVV